MVVNGCFCRHLCGNFGSQNGVRESCHACANFQCVIYGGVGVDFRDAGKRGSGRRDLLELRPRANLSRAKWWMWVPWGDVAGGRVFLYSDRDGDADGRGPGGGVAGRRGNAAECVYRVGFRRRAGRSARCVDAIRKHSGVSHDCRGELRLRRDLFDAECGHNVLDRGAAGRPIEPDRVAVQLQRYRDLVFQRAEQRDRPVDRGNDREQFLGV